MPSGSPTSGPPRSATPPAAVTQFVVLSPPDGDTRPTLILQQVPEPKGVKNRMHVDLHAADRDAAVERLVSLGARKIQEQPNCIGDYCWHLLADPEGNEFCVAPGRPRPRRYAER